MVITLQLISHDYLCGPLLIPKVAQEEKNAIHNADEQAKAETNHQ